MFDNKNRFVIENYNKQSCFASFLPGISGIHGTPLWNFYVNRGQAICSFGSENKDHSIMEFYPAHQSYQFTKTMGLPHVPEGRRNILRAVCGRRYATQDVHRYERAGD